MITSKKYSPYDFHDRLTSAQYAEGSNLSITPQYDYSDSVVYNANSAITHLQRMGKSIQGAACIDNVTLTYSGNKLNTAQDTGISASMMGDAFHFVDGDDYYSEYSYDGCGALTSDSNKGVYKILYDFNGMPTCVWFDNGSITDYVYTADGVKLKTVHRTAVPGTVPSGSTPSLSEQNTLSKDSTLYVGALEIESSIREKYYYANGYLDIVNGNLDSYNYYATDHLGNVRHVARATPSGVGSIIQANNYYPFGGLLNEGDNQLYVQKKLYNGKEYDRMQGLNLYDYGARQYDPAICRFTSMDPLCEKYYNISPYAYCAGNPMKYVDPDGCLYGDFVNDKGKIIGNDGLDDNKLYVLKTRKSKFSERDNSVQGAGVNQKETEKFIKENSGNSEAFANNDIAYRNSIEIESSIDIRTQMVAQISKDNGNGGVSGANNREYGGEITPDGINFVEGNVGSPKSDAYIYLDNSVSNFHSHPSGSLTETIDGNTTRYVYIQHPSKLDIDNAGNHTNFVFGRRDGITYIYNKQGVQATIPTKYFIKPKR